MMMTPSTALHTDLYQLTMAQGYWKLDMHARQAVFDLFYRENPFNGGYAICAGLEDVIQYINQYRFVKNDIDYLGNLKAFDGSYLFESAFLDFLLEFNLTLDIKAIEEGTVVFPKEPLVQVKGDLIQCQLIESALLNLINFSTLIATKAARICEAAKEDAVIEFGLRRAQGVNGALTASRAAFIGGAFATSNVEAAMIYNIPVRGTHAHSWIMAFDNELDAFKGYAQALPNNCIFLVDTYNSLQGVQHAIEVGRDLEKRGYRFQGIRLDSGDLANLSIEARKLLDNNGFKNTAIMASNDLDEYQIELLKQKGAKVSIWGVGTRLVTGFDQPALGGVYKLVSIQDKNGVWHDKAKSSDDVKKKTLPGIRNILRLAKKGQYFRDLSYDNHAVKNLQLKLASESFDNKEELLKPIFEQGHCIYKSPTLQEIQLKTKQQLAAFPDGIKLLHPKQEYPVEFITAEEEPGG